MIVTLFVTSSREASDFKIRLGIRYIVNSRGLYDASEFDRKTDEGVEDIRCFIFKTHEGSPFHNTQWKLGDIASGTYSYY